MRTPIIGPAERNALTQTVELLRQIVDDAARYVIRALPFLVKAFAVGAGLAGATMATVQTWLTFGQDPAAFVLGFAIGTIPFIYTMSQGLISFGGVLASGSVSALVGLTFYVLPLMYCNLIIIFVLGVLVVLDMSKRNISEELSNEQS